MPGTVWFSIQQVAINGTPDILGCANGIFVALELKASAKSRRSKLQEYNIKKINDAGGFARFVYPENWDYVQEELKKL
jgi:Holliday junction resolvase